MIKKYMKLFHRGERPTYSEPLGTDHPLGTRRDGNYPFTTIPAVGVPGRSLGDLTEAEKKAIAETELAIRRSGGEKI